MKVIISEGIATSGKTTIKNALIKEFKDQGLSYKFIDEEEILIPIPESTDRQVAINFLLNIFERIFNSSDKNDVILFDRLYFTHVFRTNSNIDDFQEIENILSRFDTTLVILTINEEKIPDRIFNCHETQRGWLGKICQKERK